MNAVKLSWSAVAALVIASVVTLAAFGWPFLAATSGVGEGASHSTDAPWIFVLVLPLLAMIVLAEVNAGGIDAKAIALLGMLASIGGALRALSPGAAGLEPSFAVIMLGGRVFGRGFGFVQGALTLFVGALLTGGVGPWLPFQMIAAGWVGFLSGALPKRLTGRSEVVVLALLGFVLGVAYGALMNLWFWPFGGYGAGLSYDAAGGPGGERGELLQVLPGDLGAVGRQSWRVHVPAVVADRSAAAARAQTRVQARGVRGPCDVSTRSQRDPLNPRVREMKTLVIGGARSGKSAAAESALADASDVTYVATGYPADHDAEWAARVARHLAHRPASWTTVETLDLAGVLAEPGGPVLVDCLTLWLTRILDRADAWESGASIEPDTSALVAALRRQRPARW